MIAIINIKAYMCDISGYPPILLHIIWHELTLDIAINKFTKRRHVCNQM